MHPTKIEALKMAYEKLMHLNSKQVSGVTVPRKSAKKEVESLDKVASPSSVDARRSIRKSAKGTKTEKYIASGLKALSQWTPGKVTTKQPIAQVIDMFCGCGGMSLGFAALAKATGAFRLIGGVDVNEVSLKTYEHNYGVPACKVDVRELANDQAALNSFLKSLPDYNQTIPTVLIGCAPCQGFTAHRKKLGST